MSNKTSSLPLQAGIAVLVEGVGDYFHLLDTTSGIDIEFLMNGAVVSSAQNMELGFFQKPKGGFSALRFTSAAGQTIKFYAGFGDGGYNRTTGAVSLLNVAGPYAQTSKSVTNVNQLLSAANLLRRVGIIQNNSAAAVLRVTFDGSAATATHGLRIMPGGSEQVPDYAPTTAINAMMETADATAGNVELIEG